MLNLNDRYRYASQHDTVEPTFTIAMHFEDDGSDIVYFTSHGPLGRPVGEGVQFVDYCVTRFNGATQRIDPKNSTSSIGSVSFDLVDIEGRVSEILRQKNNEDKSPRHKRVEIYYGFSDYTIPIDIVDENNNDVGPSFDVESLDWLDYQQQFTMLVTGYTVGKNRIRFTAEDVQRIENTDIFTLETSTLVETITAEQMFIPIAEFAQTNKFQVIEHDQSYSDRPGESVGYVRIEDEVIAHSGVVDDPSFGVSLSVLERGALNTRAVGHQVEESASDDRRTGVEEFVYLEGPALKLLYALQTGILHDQDAFLPEHWHMGIAPEFVRLEDYLNADPLLWEPVANVGRTLRFEGVEKTNGEQFIQDEILSWLVGVRPVYSDGAIGFKKLNAVLGQSSYVFEANENTVVNYGDLEHRLRDVINEIFVNWDWSFLEEEFLQGRAIVDVDSLRKYDEGDIKTYNFRGVKSSNQTLQDINNIFNGFRNRFAGGGFVFSIEVMPSINFLEVGDLIRVRGLPITDPLTNNDLDRVFEIQQVTPNSRTGRTRLSLFASVEAAGDFEVVTANTVMADSFYSSAGTELSSVAQMDGNTITADVILDGGPIMGEGIFYHDDDLILPPGVTMFINNNVQLRVRGQFVRNGDVIGAARGLTGGRGGDSFAGGSDEIMPVNQFTNLFSNPLAINSDLIATSELPGWPGYMGNSQASNFSLCTGFEGSIFSGFVHQAPIVQGRNAIADRLPLVNRDGLQLGGIGLLDMRGTSGGGSRPLLYRNGLRYFVVEPGVDGGRGGSGLVVICRGESVGASSVIDLSGEPGDVAPRYDIGDGPRVPVGSFVSNGGGGGGHPGAYYLLLDGNGLFSSSTENIQQIIGPSGLDQSVTIIDNFNDQYSSRWTYLGELQFPFNFGRGSYQPSPDLGENGFKVQFIPAPLGFSSGVIESVRYQLQPVQGAITLTSGTETLLRAADGSFRERVRVTFVLSSETQAERYEVQARFSGEPDSSYRTVAIVSTGEAFFDATDSLSYRVRVRVLGDDDVIASDWVESVDHVAIGKRDAPGVPQNFRAVIDDELGVVLLLDAHEDPDFFQFVISNNESEITRGSDPRFVLGFLPAGEYSFRAFAVDRSRNTSELFAQFNLTIRGPGVTNVAAVVVDSNVELRYRAARGSYPLRIYELFVGDDFDTAQKFEDKAGDSSFTIKQEIQPGEHTYHLRAVDVAGNVGVSGSATATVRERNDFVLFNSFSERDAGFDGVFDNAFMDGQTLIAPVNPNETWQDYVDNGFDTLQEEIEEGFLLFATPSAMQATYEKVFDLGVTLSRSIVTVEVMASSLTGQPNYVLDIAYSADGVEYTSLRGNQVAALNFQFVRITLTVESDGRDILTIDDIVTSLSLQENEEVWRSQANASDISGTFVQFTQPFIDITNIVVTPNSVSSIIATYSFVDQPNPTGFFVFLYDQNGNRVSGEFSARARGYLSS